MENTAGSFILTYSIDMHAYRVLGSVLSILWMQQ